MSKRRLTVEAVVIDDSGGVLLVRQGRTRHDWELPGGKVRKQESLLAGLQREVVEETQIQAVPQRLIGVFFIRGEAGEVFHNFVFVASVADAQMPPRPNPPEIADCGFFTLDQLPNPMGPYTRQRIADATGDAAPNLLPVELMMRDWVG
jgi:8-oxo-dGTP pyrophosphatase MutT (NUDIX family)